MPFSACYSLNFNRLSWPFVVIKVQGLKKGAQQQGEVKLSGEQGTREGAG